VADHEFHTIADELVRDRDAFFRVRAVVADENLDFLAEDAALGIDVLDRLRDAVLELRAEGGAAAGHWAANSNTNRAERCIRGRCGRGGGQRCRNRDLRPWRRRGRAVGAGAHFG
jgi:hypothetical protein